MKYAATNHLFVLVVICGAFLITGCSETIISTPICPFCHFEGYVYLELKPYKGEGIIQVEVKRGHCWVFHETRSYWPTGHYELFISGNDATDYRIRASVPPKWSGWKEGIIIPNETVLDTFFFWAEG